MTKCNQKRPALKRLRRQAVEVDFQGGTMTSDGGLLLLREVENRLNLISRAAQIIPDPRDPLYTSHTQIEMLTSRVFGIAAGYEDGNDHQDLRHDPCLSGCGWTHSCRKQLRDGLPFGESFHAVKIRKPRFL